MADGVNIDPNASNPYANSPYGQAGEPSVNNQAGTQTTGTAGTVTPTVATNPSQAAAQTGGQTTPSLGAPQGPQGMYTPDQLTAQQAQAVQQANLSVAAAWDEVRKQQDIVTRLQNDPATAGNPQLLTDATSTLNTLYTKLTQAETNLSTANVAYGSALEKAIVDPSQADLQKASAAKARADADTAKAQAQVLTDGAPGQRALVAAQAGQASASAAAQQAAADATKAKTPAEIAQLNAQASALNAQAAQTSALLPGLIDKQKAEVGLTQAQTDLTDSQSALAQAQAGQAGANADLIKAQTATTQASLAAGQPQATAALTTAQAGLAGTQGTNQLAQAASQLAGIQSNVLGPLYGLQDRVNAIRAIQQQVFGPGGSGDPAEANDLLNQFVSSSIAGTTPYAASVAAANAGLTQFGTQAGMYNAAQQALASRASALAGLGGNVLNTLAGMNVNAPAGSTAMAGAFKDVVDYMANKVAAGQAQGAAPGQAGGALQQPTAPALPPLLQRLAGLPGAAPAPGAPVAAAPPGAATGALATLPAQPQPQPQPQGQTSAPITINVGSGSNQTQPWTPPGSNYSYSGPPPWTGATPQPLPSQTNQPSTYGQLSGSMPGAIQQYAPPTTDFVHQLWGNELQSGAVKSPYAAMQQPIAAPTPAAVM